MTYVGALLGASIGLIYTARHRCTVKQSMALPLLVNNNLLNCIIILQKYLSKVYVSYNVSVFTSESLTCEAHVGARESNLGIDFKPRSGCLSCGYRVLHYMRIKRAL